MPSDGEPADSMPSDGEPADSVPSDGEPVDSTPVDGVAGNGAAGAGSLPLGLDHQTLLEALAAGGFLDGDPDDQDTVLADELEAEQDGRLGPPLPLGQVAALAVEHMPPGPAMAGWLNAAAQASGQLDEYGLAGMAIAARQLTSWAQAAELAAVAQVTARAAAADPRIGLADDGRPVRVCRDAVGQVSLALMLTDYSATAWADLATVLAWRLPATGAALAAGQVDLDRVQVIAEATSVLPVEAARVVEEQVLPGAGRLTRPKLRERLRHLVIAADPEGAERRREQAERAAKVSLYPDPDGTATLTGSGLPQIEAAAAMTRITAIAKAMKAAGQVGGLDLHRAKVMLGLLLGTLPYIPPPDGAPEPPPPGDGPGDNGGPGDNDPGGGDHPADDDHPSGGGPGDGSGPGDGLGSDPGGGGPGDDLPTPGDEDAPDDDGLDGPDQDRPWDSGDEDDDLPETGPAPVWPELGVIPPALGRPVQPADGRPVPGLLEVTVPWATWAGQAGLPGLLGRIGPITAAQARHLAHTAANDPAAQWRVIVTNNAGQAIAVTRIRRTRRGYARDRPGQARDGPPPGAGLVGRITVTIRQDAITASKHLDRQEGTGQTGPPGQAGPPGGLATAVLRAATRALERALAQAEADEAAGGCAHQAESRAYRPPPRLREYVAARDVTCRNPVCRQPAWRGDLDHTRPFDQGGKTCRCNLGGGCRRDHQLKQHPRWKLQQIRPGVFRWTTPAGRTYCAEPDTHPV
jgi:Domain of unknown function (DUF222)